MFKVLLLRTTILFEANVHFKSLLPSFQNKTSVRMWKIAFLLHIQVKICKNFIAVWKNDLKSIRRDDNKASKWLNRKRKKDFCVLWFGFRFVSTTFIQPLQTLQYKKSNLKNYTVIKSLVFLSIELHFLFVQKNFSQNKTDS